MQRLTPLSTQNRQTKAIREQIAAYIFDEVREAWLNSCPVTPAVMCSGLKCGQQMTLSRTVADYTSTLDQSCVWSLEQCFLENNKTLEHFLTHTSVVILILWIQPLWGGWEYQCIKLWMHNFSFVCHNRWLSSAGVKAKHSPLFSTSVRQPLH